MNGFLQDLRFAARLLRRSPGFSAAAVSILAVGIAAITVIFSIVDSALLRPLPFPHSERLFSIVTADVKQHFRAAASPPDFLDYRRSVPSFERVAATMPWYPSATGDAPPERLNGLLVSANFFSMLGVSPARGRGFLPREEEPGNEKVVILGDTLWRRRFGGDPGLVGKNVRFNGDSYTVVGIMPPGFTWGERYGRNSVAELWAPFTLTPARTAADQRGNEYLDLIARLRPGVSRARAQSEVDALFERFQRDYPDNFPRGGGLKSTLTKLQEDLVGSARAPLWLLLGAVAFLLAIACTNVAGLLLARAAARRTEIAIRVSLGATRSRILRQLLSESALLAAVAGAAGAALAAVALSAIRHRGPAAFPGIDRLRLDGAVAAFTLGVSALTAVLFGLLPAAGVSRRELREEIEAGRGSAGRPRTRLRRALVASQIGLASLLLVGAGLLVMSLTKILHVDPGFQAQGVVTGQVSLPRLRYPDRPRRAAFAQAAVDQLAGLPGVAAAGAVEILPMTGESNSGTFEVENRPAEPGGTKPHAEIWRSTPDYFPAMRIGLRRGRLFDPGDRSDSLPVALVDEVLARKYWSGQDPVGRRIDFEGDPGKPMWRVVVGVVATIKARSLDDEPRPALYVPFAQSPPAMMTLVVRVNGDSRSAARALRNAVAAIDAEQPVANVEPLTVILSESVASRRLATVVLSGFAAAAVLLASIGLYGVLAYTVNQRRREIGIRMALGARPSAVLGLVFSESASMIALGIVGGLAAAALVTRWLKTFLFGVAPFDPVVDGAVVLLLAGVGFLASSGPAWRASTINPIDALRDE
jgi:putative ABC transport system permease protein